MPVLQALRRQEKRRAWRWKSRAEIVFIGEGPGKARLARRTVCGSGRKFLNEMLAGINLKEDVFITNVVKCRPPRIATFGR